MIRVTASMPPTCRANALHEMACRVQLQDRQAVMQFFGSFEPPLLNGFRWSIVIFCGDSPSKFVLQYKHLNPSLSFNASLRSGLALNPALLPRVSLPMTLTHEFDRIL